MSNVDIAQLVISALEQCNCASSLIGDIDNHSTIEINLIDLPSIYISLQDCDIWLWSHLCEYSNIIFNQCAAEFLTTLMNGCYVMNTGQLQLGVQNGSLLLKGAIHNDYLYDGSKFLEALDEFLIQLERFHRLLLR